MTPAALLAACADEWAAAIGHPFLRRVAAGSLPPGAFAAWLAQDYPFVGDLLSFQAHLLARAPRPAQAVLSGGLVALEAELTWFELQAAARGPVLPDARQSSTGAYRRALDELGRGPFAAAIAGLRAIERAYLDAGRAAAPGALAYREFVSHWTTPDFDGYVRTLRAARVVRLETAFWAMAFEAER